MIDKALYPNVYLAIHAMLGAFIGFLSSCIFLLLYYFTEYTVPISEHLRFSNAFWDTFYIDVIILVILFHKDIRAQLAKLAEKGEDSDEIN